MTVTELVLAGREDGGEPVVEHDPYVPVTVTWPRYHRTADFAYAMYGRGEPVLELKVDRGSGALVELVCLGAAEPSELAPDSAAVPSDPGPGVPVFDLERSETGRDVALRRDVYVQGAGAWLMYEIGGRTPVSYLASGGGAVFGFDGDGRLASVRVPAARHPGAQDVLGNPDAAI